MLYRLGYQSTVGRSLSPLSLSSKTFSFTSSLPDEFTYQRNDSVATYRDQNGFLQVSDVNTPRFEHTSTGIPLGLRIEPSKANKCENNNAMPSSLNGLTVSAGSPVITYPNDTTALEVVGLHQIGGGAVIKIDNSASGSSCSVDIDGACGNVNPHSFSVWARMGAGNGDLRRTGSGTSTSVISGNSYKRYKIENEVPSFTGAKMRLRLNAGAVT